MSEANDDLCLCLFCGDSTAAQMKLEVSRPDLAAAMAAAETCGAVDSLYARAFRDQLLISGKGVPLRYFTFPFCGAHDINDPKVMEEINRLICIAFGVPEIPKPDSCMVCGKPANMRGIFKPNDPTLIAALEKAHGPPRTGQWVLFFPMCSACYHAPGISEIVGRMLLKRFWNGAEGNKFIPARVWNSGDKPSGHVDG